MMNYTHIALLCLSFLGIILHILVELNKLNKQSKGSFTLKKYFEVEIYSILISIIVSIVCVYVSQEIKQLEQVGRWLGLAFVAIGYMGQSLLIAFMGKAQIVVDNTLNKSNDTTTQS